jgi:molybdopterin converting factor small subunit
MTVLTFGIITEIIGKSSFDIDSVATTAELKEKLETEFPRLRSINYALAVDKQMVTTDAPIAPGATVALLPPFSGG